MRRTDYAICCGTQGKYGYPVYRVAVTDGKRYYIKWKGSGAEESKIIDVTDQINAGAYTSNRLLKGC